jgi:diaminohydroxyphosphoribosylaminopyrimidine deaminase/5-amino-6-(5-phosphoribosylamino)uracil reductase
MVGAVLVKAGKIIGRGWHRRAGEPHAEIEALNAARRQGNSPKGATLYVTLEPCSSRGRTPPCTEAIISAGIATVVVGAMDPNPRHHGKAFRILSRAGIKVTRGVLSAECERLNEAFNHWIVHRTPFVLVKAALTLDGKMATASGESKWITGEEARAYGMHLRRGVDGVLVGINTVLADNPSLTIREPGFHVSIPAGGQRNRGKQNSRFNLASPIPGPKALRRVVLDAYARTPLTANIVNDQQAALTTIVVGKCAPKARVDALAKKVRIVVAPSADSAESSHPPPAPRRTNGGTASSSLVRLDLKWVVQTLGKEDVTHLLVEGGGEVNASFLMNGLAHRIAFFYAPKIIGGRQAPTAVEGQGVGLRNAIRLSDLEWHKLGQDWLMTARVLCSLHKPNPSR